MVNWNSPLIWKDPGLAREIKALPAGRFNLYNDLARAVWRTRVMNYRDVSGFDGNLAQLQEIAGDEREIRNIGPVKREVLRAFLSEREAA